MFYLFTIIIFYSRVVAHVQLAICGVFLYGDKNATDEIIQQPEDENVVTIGESVTCSVAASVAATLSMNEPTVVTVTSGAAPPTLIATTTAPATTSVILSTETLSSTTVSAAPPTLIADSLPTTSTTKSAVSEVSSLATSTSTPTAESAATPITESAAPPITESAAPSTTTSVVIDYADQNKPVVKGPAGIIYESREEAGDFYTIFLDGRRILKLSYAIPPVAI